MNESHNQHQNAVSLSILGKSYKVKCPIEKVSELRESAQYLESKMLGIGPSNKAIGSDRVIVIAALNIVHEFLAQKRQVNTYVEAMGERITDLHAKIIDTLASVEEAA
jgi:cell division protein ZapA